MSQAFPQGDGAIRGEDLRNLMRFVPHNVAVLTVDHEGDRMGVTISSLVSLSLDPPLIGVSLGKEASCYDVVRRAGAFAISLLGSDQEELARRFAASQSPSVYWSGVAIHAGKVAPLLDDALGWIEARTRAEHEAGDHTFFIADVVGTEHDLSRGPLIYCGRAYHTL